MQVRLDRKALFALASDTRLEILRALQPMRRTVTQLAEAVQVDKAAVHRHLQKLVEGELVKRYEDHGFVYYGLTWKARDLLAPGENTKVVLLLASAAASALGAAVTALLYLAALAATGGPAAPRGGAGSETGPGLAGAPLPLQPGAPAVPSLAWPLLALALGVAAVAAIAAAWRSLRRPKQRGGVGLASRGRP